MLIVVLGHRHGCGNSVLGDWLLAGLFPTTLVWDGPSPKKGCKNRGFGRSGGSAWQCSASAANSWSVNSGNFFFVCSKLLIFQNFTGPSAFEPIFPGKI